MVEEIESIEDDEGGGGEEEVEVGEEEEEEAEGEAAGKVDWLLGIGRRGCLVLGVGCCCWRRRREGLAVGV